MGCGCGKKKIKKVVYPKPTNVVKPVIKPRVAIKK